jgi:serine phosphatase RsbU (regulator of sigma subunit)
LWRKQIYVLRERPVETVGILGTTGALSWLAVWTGLSPSLLILPTLAWAALRLDVLGAALAGAGAALAANLRAASGLTLLEGVGLSAPGRTALIQALIAVNVLLAMLIAQEGAARRTAAREKAAEQLERQRLQNVAAVLHSAAHPAPAEVSGVDYSACYQPAEEESGLGGDWYSVLALRKNRVYLSVGDVVGHGLTAVEDMAQLRSAANAYAYQGLAPTQVLAELNDFAGNVSQGGFATAVAAVYDPLTGTLSYSSAGHPPALLRRAKTGEVTQLGEAGGPVLGPIDDVTYPEAAVSVDPGDVIVMYTDGLVEHPGDVVQTGISHLERVVANWPPDALLDSEALVAEVAPRPHPDDVCVLVVRIKTAEQQQAGAASR